MLFNRSKVFKCEAAFANSGRCDRFFSGARLLDAEEPLPVQRDEIMADKAMKIPGLDHPSRITSPGSPPRPAIPNNSVRSVRKPRAFSRRTGSARIERLGPAKRILAAAGEARRHQRCRTRIPTFAFVRPWSRRPSRPPRRQGRMIVIVDTVGSAAPIAGAKRGLSRRAALTAGAAAGGGLLRDRPWPVFWNWKADGMLMEHWDVFEGKATKAESQSGLPMFGTTFPE